MPKGIGYAGGKTVSKGKPVSKGAGGGKAK